MGSDWIELTIEELASPEKSSLSTGPFGSAISAKFFQEEGVPVIRGSNLSTQTSEKMNDDGLVFVSEEKASEFKRSIVRSGDLIFTCWGTINQVGLITEECKYSEYIISNKQMKATLDKTKADPLFVYYYFSSPIKQKEIIQNGIGAAVPGFNLGQLKQHKLRLPSLTEQKKISSFLGLLDTKITLNRQINQTLEQMAQTLFKSWFVDFDPVIDNALDAGNAIPDELQARAEQRQALRHAVDETNAANQPQSTRTNPAAGDALASPYKPLPDDIRQLFPNEFEESELGWVPKGWTYQDAQNVASVSIGKTPPRKESQWFSESSRDNIIWISIRDMGGFGVFTGNSNEYLTPEAVSKFHVKRVPKDSVLLSFKLTLGRVSIAHEELTTNEAIAHFVSPKFGLNKEFLYSYLSTFNYGSLGSTSSIATAVNSKIIKKMPILIPMEEVCNEFKVRVEQLFEKMKLVDKEVVTLINIRDTLLPKLISGELRLDEVESTIAETTTA